MTHVFVIIRKFTEDQPCQRFGKIFNLQSYFSQKFANTFAFVITKRKNDKSQK
jgi:hypothetical protein